MQVLIMCVSKCEVAIAECMGERERERGGGGEREVLKKVGEQEDVQPIIPIQGCEVS